MSYPEEAKTKMSVEELPWFPFASFEEFRDACRNGSCCVAVDRSAALDWVHGGKYSTRSSSFVATALTLTPFLAVLAFVAYSISGGSWLLLLALPLFVAAYFLFHPAVRGVSRIGTLGGVLGLVRSGSIVSSSLGFLWGVFSESSGLAAVTVVLLLIWLCHLAVDKETTTSLTKAVTGHEDLLCEAWLQRAFAIRFADGRTELVDSQRDRAALFPDIARDEFDEIFPKALEGDKRALAQLWSVLGRRITTDDLKTMDRGALQALYTWKLAH